MNNLALMAGFSDSGLLFGPPCIKRFRFNGVYVSKNVSCLKIDHNSPVEVKVRFYLLLPM